MLNDDRAAVTFGTGLPKKGFSVPIRSLAEAVLLQSFEDLWSDEEKSNSIEFFASEGFLIYSEIAGMSFNEKLRMQNLIITALDRNSTGRKKHIRSNTNNRNKMPRFGERTSPLIGGVK